jgi:DNA-binding transcriptional MerR regulator
MVQKVAVEKRLYYKIGEACKVLDIQPYVLRYWETEFAPLSPSKSRSGQRVYSEKELHVIRRIKELLYEEGYTIAGAKKKLESEMATGAVAEDDDAPAEEEKKVRRTKKATSREAAAKSLDRNETQQIERMRRGIKRALNEAREILVALDEASPQR